MMSPSSFVNPCFGSEILKSKVFKTSTTFKKIIILPLSQRIMQLEWWNPHPTKKEKTS